MAFGVVRLSAKGRKNLRCLFISISLFMCVISATLISYGAYITLKIAPSMPTEKSIITFIFTVISINGMELLTYYIFGIKVCKKCLSDAHKKHSKYLLKIWTLTGFSTVINVIIIATMASSVSNNLIRSIHYSLERGIRHYLKETLWKTAIDKLQFEYECCGVNSFKDWHQIAWMTTNQVKAESDTLNKYKKYGENIFLPVLPWSCCKKSKMRCLHDPIQQLSEPGFDDGVLHSINDIGCMDILRKPLENGFLLFILDSYILFALQIILSIIIKIIFTSSRSAAILGDKNGESPGWIIGSGTSILLSEFDKLKPTEKMTEDDIESLLTDCGVRPPPCEEVKVSKIKCETEVERHERIEKEYSKIKSETEVERHDRELRIEKEKSEKALSDVTVGCVLYEPEMNERGRRKKKKRMFKRYIYEQLDSCDDSSDETNPIHLEKKLFLSDLAPKSQKPLVEFSSQLESSLTE